MICPYCGEDTATTMEHFYPKSIANNQFDFYACQRCNHLKRSHIILPTDNIFKVRPSGFNKNKFWKLWDVSGYNKYTLIVPWRKMLGIFDGYMTYYDVVDFSWEEEMLYGFEQLRKMILSVQPIIDGDSKMQALVLSERAPVAYLVHSYNFEFNTSIKGVKSMNISKYNSSGNYGYRVYGSGKNYMWELASSKEQYFRNLLKI